MMSQEVKINMLKPAYQLSMSLKKLSKTYSNSFKSDQYEFTGKITATTNSNSNSNSNKDKYLQDVWNE